MRVQEAVGQEMGTALVETAEEAEEEFGEVMLEADEAAPIILRHYTPGPRPQQPYPSL